MNKRFKARWLKALRTPLDEGGYIKGRGRLARTVGDEHCFCVMGVAADLLAQDGEYDWDGNYDEVFSLLESTLETIGMTVDQQERLIDVSDRPSAWADLEQCLHTDDRWQAEIALVKTL